MRAIALGALLAAALPGCTHYELNSVSVAPYDPDDAPVEVAGKSLLNVVPWTLYGVAIVLYTASSVAPEAVVAAVDSLTSR